MKKSIFVRKTVCFDHIWVGFSLVFFLALSLSLIIFLLYSSPIFSPSLYSCFCCLYLLSIFIFSLSSVVSLTLFLSSLFSFPYNCVCISLSLSLCLPYIESLMCDCMCLYMCSFLTLISIGITHYTVS